MAELAHIKTQSNKMWSDIVARLYKPKHSPYLAENGMVYSIYIGRQNRL